MKFQPTLIPGVFVVESEPSVDSRGSFKRIWCRRELEAHGLESTLVQCSLSTNPIKGTLRGMHYQAGRAGESKLVQCLRGAIYDVALDLRRDSPMFRRWHGEVLRHDNHRAMFVPKGVAHGFLTLDDDSDVLYQISEFFCADAARGVRWNDPAFNIKWPSSIAVISERDRSYANFAE